MHNVGYGKEKRTMKSLIECQREYIALLEKALADNAAFLYVHGRHAKITDIEKGIELRKKIKELELCA